ncbi:pyridoxamine 5'-phosphate oxidase family protein [Nonomuraea sp. LPB2021202275-12-8]|uniref:pyridoxamine 5'-phosphate oxidase family protein n=1 Tax=Nonomuraea sp. LPB2021202275-12-8 TaxID=3120159 RepID=UPI00300D8573
MSTRASVPGDLGQRVAYHRERLSLTREDLAERAGMTAGYVEYVEGNPANVTQGTLVRLAGALETSTDDLLGGGTNGPPGYAGAVTKPVLNELGPEECLRLIAAGGIGRVAFSGPSGPTVLPVNYRMHDGAVVFRTRAGGPMDQNLRTRLEGVEVKIGFEVDWIDEAKREGWSVLIQGPAHHVTSDETPAVSGARVDSWAGGERELYIRIIPHQITGRRIRGF